MTSTRRGRSLASHRWAPLAAMGLLIISSGAVFGVHGQGSPVVPNIFELEGDADDDAPLQAGTDVIPDGALPDDWASLFPTAVSTNPLSTSFTDDHPAVDETYFFGGSSKDDIDIDTVAGTPGSGGWLRDKTSSAQPKADIIDSFAATYLGPDVSHLDGPDADSTPDGGDPDSLPDTYVYFGMDRFSNDGATFGGFWFLQNAISYGATAANGVGEIHGSHVGAGPGPGDILIITDFTQGGQVANFAVFEWVGTGGDVTSGTLQRVFQGTDCDLSNANDKACSNVNSAAETSPWPFIPKANVGPAGTFQPGLFLEGGINLSSFFPGEDPCFTNFVAETRASFSVDSTLSDFTSGTFNTCGSVEALKYHDRNADGTRDADGVDNTAGNADDESPLAGWTVFIDKNGNEILDAAENTAANAKVTGSDGKVSFVNLVAGTYSFCEVLDNATGQTHAGWFNSDPTGTTLCISVTLAAAGTQSIDFGNYQNGTKSGFKYEDENADSNFVAADGDAKLANWVIWAIQDDNGDGNLDAGELSDKTTDATDDGTGGTTLGAYSFSLKPGKYFICEEAQATGASGWLQSSPKTGDTTFTAKCDDQNATASPVLAAGGYYITVSSQSSDTDNEFGNYKNGSKSGFKYEDENADSNFVAADGDAKLGDWVIWAIQDDNGDGVLDAGELSDKTTDTTDSAAATLGDYSFSLAPGKYFICEKAQSAGSTGWIQSSPKTGDGQFTDKCDDQNADASTPGLAAGGYYITISSQSTDTDNEFGNYKNGTKSGFKYEDEENDSDFDAGEGDAKLAGWVIWAITDDNGDGVLDAGELSDKVTDTTDDGTGGTTLGAYSFSLAPGKYFICEEAQATGASGWLQSSPKTGDGDFTDRCDDQNATANPDLAAGGYYITISSQSSDTNNEFGNYKNGSKSGFKYEDEDANDAFNGTDAKLGNWVIWAIQDDNGDGNLDAGELTGALSDTTDSAAATLGEYSFSLPPGKYFICEEAQGAGLNGWIQSSPETGDTTFTSKCDDQNLTADPDLAAGGYYITVTSQSSDTDNEFGNYRKATKSGVKWHDRNGDGIRQANGADGDAATAGDNEELLSGWVIHLFGTDGQGNTIHVTDTTDDGTLGTSLGAYSFTLDPGTYTVCEVLQSGWAQTYPAAATAGSADCAGHTHTATITPGGRGWAITMTSGDVDTNNDFGNRELYRIIVLTCSEVSGLLVASDVTLGGTTKTSIIANPAGVTGNLCTLGGAQFDNLAPGTYPVSVKVPK